LQQLLPDLRVVQASLSAVVRQEQAQSVTLAPVVNMEATS
jgi:hypothetical protein